MDELKKLLDDPHTGLRPSSDTNKTRSAILAMFAPRTICAEVDEMIDELEKWHKVRSALFNIGQKITYKKPLRGMETLPRAIELLKKIRKNYD